MIESILSKLAEIASRYKEIEGLLSQPDVTSDQENYIKISKEYSDLAPVVNAYKEYLEAQKGLEEALVLSKDEDPDMRAMAEGEISELKERTKDLVGEIKKLLLP